ncbi:MAG: energy transducer TonB [Bdellovibrionota bacterium]
MADQNTRDFRQRSLGWFGVSMVAHVGVLALLALGPRSEALQPSGTPEGTAPGAAMVELDTPATGMNEPSAATAAPDAQASDIAASAPSEVLLASNDDANAVPLPAAMTPERVEPKKIAAPVIVETKAIVAKPKVAKAKPVKAAPAAKADRPDGDIESALVAARNEPKEESQPEALAQNEEPAEPATAEPQEQTPDEEHEQEIETAKTEETAATISAATSAAAPKEEEAPAAEPAQEEAPKVAALVQKPAPQAPAQAAAAAQAPAPAAAQSAPIATAPANSMAAPMSQQGSGGTTPQPGVAAAQPGPPVAGQSVRAGGLGYAVPMGVRIRDASELVARKGNPSPVYPQQDRLLGRQGLAVVVGKVSNDGSVISVSLERSSGSASMDQEAMKTFSKWKFMPGQQGMVRKPFQFVLAGTAKELPARLRY